MSMHHQYNGFEVYAHAYESSRGGYVPSVTLTRGNPSEHSGAQVRPACEISGGDQGGSIRHRNAVWL